MKPARTKWDPPGKVVYYPAERTCVVKYFADHNAQGLIKTERGAYGSRAIARATERLLRMDVKAALMVVVYDEVENTTLAVLRLMSDRVLETVVTDAFVKLRAKNSS